MREWDFISCLRFRHHFLLGIPNFKIFGFWIFFFFIWIFSFHRKMCRLFPCITIFKGFFWLKVQKECGYVIMLKITLSLVKNVFFDVKKCISELVSQIAAKPTTPQTCNFVKNETLAQVFSCEFCEISKNTFFTEHLRATASVTFSFSSGSFLYSLQVTLIKGGVKFELTGNGQFLHIFINLRVIKSWKIDLINSTVQKQFLFCVFDVMGKKPFKKNMVTAFFKIQLLKTF